MASGLIDIERAKRNIQSITYNSQDALLGVLIGAYSDAIQKWCRRDFALRLYDELYNGNGERRLMLRQYPIQSVESVRYRPVTVLNVINNDPATNQQARVQVTSVGIKLMTMASGVRTNISDSTLSYSSYPTLQSMATAISALGNGWSAQVVGDAGGPGLQGDYGLWPSADLYVPASFGDGTQSQGALTCRAQNAELKMHTYELQGYQWDARGRLLRAIPYTDPELMHPGDLLWPPGINNFRIQYTAGYATIPEAVQEACARWVAIGYQLTLRDPALTTQKITGAIWQIWKPQQDAQPPLEVQALLHPYRRYTVSLGQS
jgi:hypothetical protein